MNIKTILSFLTLITISFSNCRQMPKDMLTIAIAANMQFVMRDLMAGFTEKTGIDCNLVVSSSGTLTAQISEGAAYDLLLSADMKYPQLLFDKGIALDTPVVYALGKLVLWTMQENFILSPEILVDPRIKYIALANPKTAPYGRAALEMIDQMGIRKTIENKLVYGESISQTNQFITSKSADIGFTSKSVVLAPVTSGKGHWIEIDPDFHQPIQQGIVLLNGNPDKFSKARKFKEFLFSGAGKDILNKFGYSTNLL